ncbi:MAG TPA: hypothetical protein VLC48_01345 [Gemmatimonadota bacterium]|nr:hypothetical protein [Gemmatimonadota bacterium]
MSPFLVETIMPFLAMMGLGGMVLIGMKLRYQHLQRLKGGGSSAEDVQRIAESVDSLKDEVRLMREEMLSINDRVEFTEKLLERPR